ncbi:hypothetical protein JCM11641_001663 [Rhodosporidiobolus odoratus]
MSSPEPHTLSPLSSSRSLPATPPHSPPTPASGSIPKKKERVAIVGAGFCGIGALLAFLDTQKQLRHQAEQEGREWAEADEWEIEVLEKRAQIGGVWLPDSSDHLDSQREKPQTPLYPSLRTNTATPTMTFPSRPFPPLTPVFAPHSRILSYLDHVVSSIDLDPYIHLSISRRSWPDREKRLRIARSRNRTISHAFVPSFAGQDAWLAPPSSASASSTSNKDEKVGDREITHSLSYRDPERYRGRTVVIVGNGASGWDIASQLVGIAEKALQVYHSSTPPLLLVQVYHSSTPPLPSSPGLVLPPVSGGIVVPRISHLTPSGIHFCPSKLHGRGSFLPTSPEAKVSIVLCTGHRLSIPFLEPHLIQHIPSPASCNPASDHFQRLHADKSRPNSSGSGFKILNGVYLSPLAHSIFPLPPTFSTASPPPNALSILNLPYFAAAGHQSYIQGLVVGHAIAAQDGGWGIVSEGGGKEAALLGLVEAENRMREEGVEVLKDGPTPTDPSRRLLPIFDFAANCPDLAPRTTISSPSSISSKCTPTSLSRPLQSL